MQVKHANLTAHFPRLKKLSEMTKMGRESVIRE